mgnify:CR=1 FL=1
MTDTMKLNRLLNQAKLNERVTRNSVHISLNFDPKDKGMSRERLMEIAESYMSKIGFGDQPFLVYRHDDAGHPHIHIISVKVSPDGSRIDMQNMESCMRFCWNFVWILPGGHAIPGGHE